MKIFEIMTLKCIIILPHLSGKTVHWSGLPYVLKSYKDKASIVMEEDKHWPTWKLFLLLAYNCALGKDLLTIIKPLFKTYKCL